MYLGSILTLSGFVCQMSRHENFIGLQVLRNWESITQEDYIPSKRGIARIREKGIEIQEYKINSGSIPIHLFQVSDQLYTQRKLIYQFENVTSIVFAVDLSCYDVASFEELSLTQIIENMLLFEPLAKAPWFSHKSFFLLLCNVQRFKQKLPCSPLRDYFPDFNDPN